MIAEAEMRLIEFREFLASIHFEPLFAALLLLIVFLAVGAMLSLILRRGIKMMLKHDQDGRIDRMGASFLEQFGQVFV